MEVFNRLRRRIGKFNNSKLIMGLAVVGSCAVIGTGLTLMSRAATPFSSLEAEQGTLASGATLVTDATASGGSAVKFGSSTTAKPNIVLILTDDQTLASVAKMPYLSGRSDWIKFGRAHINNGLCCPSRATVLTGQYDTNNKVTHNSNARLLNEAQTLPVWLGNAGYQSGMFGKYLNQYPFGRGNYVPAGWNEWQAAYSAGPDWQLYDQYQWKLNSNGVSRDYLSAPADYQVNVLSAKMTSWIQAKAAARQPFFAMFTPTATHSPWKASPTREGTHSSTAITRAPSFNEADVSDKPAFIRALPLQDGPLNDSHRRLEFEGAASVDDAIKQLDATLTSAGVIDNTVVIFVSDNGYAYGNHRWERKRCAYDECSHVPLYVRYPGQSGRTNNTHLVSNVDLAATIAEIAGATTGVPQDGKSMLPLIRNTSTTWRDALLMHWPGGNMEGTAGQPDSIPQFWSVLAETSRGLYRYTELDTGEKELYDQTADPYELVNKASDASYNAVEAEIKAKLDTLKSQSGAAAAASPLRTDMPSGGALGPDLD